MKSSNYSFAQEQFAAVGVDTEAALQKLDQIPVSMHCWQGDDVAGFEAPEKAGAGNGCLATGNYPGKATTPAQLMADIEQAAAHVPGPLRLNLHASYATDGQPLPERDELTVENFRSWIDWAKARDFGIDFNPTSFSHPKAEDGNPSGMRQQRPYGSYPRRFGSHGGCPVASMGDCLVGILQA
jgi:L-rhamnose isomerase